MTTFNVYHSPQSNSPNFYVAQSHAVAYIGHRNTIKKKAYRPTRRLTNALLCLILRNKPQFVSLIATPID